MNKILFRIKISLMVIVGALGTAHCSRPKPVNPYAIQRLNICVANIHNREYATAKLNCELCLQFDKSTPECLNGLGIVAISQGQSEQAISWFTQAIHYNKNFAQARSNLGTIYMDRGDFAKSLPFFKAAVQMDPGFTDARYNYALANLRLDYQILAAQPKKAHVLFQDAITQYEMLIQLDVHYVNAYRDLGLIKTYQADSIDDKVQQTEKLQDATEYFQHCLQIDPQNEVCLQSLAHTFLIQERYQAAIKQYLPCLAVNKHNAHCISGLQQAQAGQNLQTSALAHFSDTIKENPKNALLRFAYCQALYGEGMDDEATRQCQQAVTLDSTLCSAHFALGMYYKKLFNGDKAATNCRGFLECDNAGKSKAHISECKQVLVAVQ